ncbi:DUF3332 domain-containing protein [Bacteroidota bacterium]
MKKFRLLSLAALLLAASLFCNSCYGPFNLTTKLHSWNGTVGGKWANATVFFAFIVLPVYDVCLFLDAFIFNTIEFWGGNNPISMEEGEEDIQILSQGNKKYQITATKNKFHIKQLEGPNAGEFAEIIFVPEESSCYLNYKDETTKLVEYVPVDNGNDRVNLFLPGGNMVSMDSDERDHSIIQAAIQSGSHYLASKE